MIITYPELQSIQMLPVVGDAPRDQQAKDVVKYL